MSDFTFIDLFAGIGGFRLGLSSAGGKAVFTNEWDRYAATTYSAWFGDENISTDDIRLLDPRTEIPDHDVLSAGFPCHLFLSYCESGYRSPDEVVGFPEGASSQVLVNRYERDPRNRKAAIAIHGESCMACGFNFRKVYGDLGTSYIVVHHLTPVSAIGDDYIINPRTDLVTICANCHAMVHRTNPPLSLIELKSLLDLK